MAKKPKPISYGPNTALIAGEAAARKYQSGSAGLNVKAFTEGFVSTYAAGLKEQEKLDAIRESYLDDLKSPQNARKIEVDYNKKAIDDFLISKKDEYAKAVECYSKTKDRGCKEKMEDIKYSFTNLNSQLENYLVDKQKYLDSFDKGQVIDLKGDERYASIYTNKGQFSIEDNGDIGFTNNGKYDKFNDIAGKWNVKNNIGETLTLKTNLEYKQIGEKGGHFYKDDIKNLYSLTFKQTGSEGIMVMAKTDITGDNEYVLPDGRKAGNLSFEAMWSQGLLDDKFYTEFSKDGGSDWMWDKANSDKLNDLISEYYTDVTESSYNQGKANYKDPKATGPGSGKNPYGKGGVNPGNKSAGWQDGATLLTRRTQAENNQPFTGVFGEYEPQGDGTWILNGDKENPMSTYKVFSREQLLQPGDTVDQYGTKGEVEQEFVTSNIDIFKNTGQTSAISKIKNIYDFNSAGIKLIKPPGVFSGWLARTLNIHNKANLLVVQGPNGGFYDWNEFDEGDHLLEYGGDTGVKPPSGAQPLTLELNVDNNKAVDMLAKLEKLANMAGVTESIPMLTDIPGPVKNQ